MFIEVQVVRVTAGGIRVGRKANYSGTVDPGDFGQLLGGGCAGVGVVHPVEERRVRARCLQHPEGQVA